MKVSKLIHDLHEQLEENKSAIDECVFLRNENEGYLEEIRDLKREIITHRASSLDYTKLIDDMKKKYKELKDDSRKIKDDLVKENIRFKEKLKKIIQFK